MERFYLQKLNDVAVNSIRFKFQIRSQLWKTWIMMMMMMIMIMWLTIGL